MRFMFLFYLLIVSIVDIRTRKIPAVWIYAGLVGMGIYGLLSFVEGRKTLPEWVCALLPGIVCFLFAKVSKAMGEGDAWIMVEMGLGFSFLTVMQIILFAFFLGAAGSIILVIGKRNLKNRRVPFVPYLFLAAAFIV